MHDIHPIQLAILKKLMYNPKLTFNMLLVENLTSKHFNYHLQELVKSGFVYKNNKDYLLSNEGKDYVSRVDEANMDVERQPKVSVGIMVIRESKEGKAEYLLNRRLKEPYYGKVGGCTGKVRFGETMEEAARRELFEETGLTGDFEFNKVLHKLAYKVGVDGIKTMVQDSVRFDFKVTNPRGDFIEKIADQENFWSTYEEIRRRKDLFNTFLKAFEYIIHPVAGVQYFEEIVEAEGY